MPNPLIPNDIVEGATFEVKHPTNTHVTISMLLSLMHQQEGLSLVDTDGRSFLFVPENVHPPSLQIDGFLWIENDGQLSFPANYIGETTLTLKKSPESKHPMFATIVKMLPG